MIVPMLCGMAGINKFLHARGELRAAARFPVYLGVAQLVACYLGVVEAAGSSPVTQTRENRVIS